MDVISYLTFLLWAFLLLCSNYCGRFFLFDILLWTLLVNTNYSPWLARWRRGQSLLSSTALFYLWLILITEWLLASVSLPSAQQLKVCTFCSYVNDMTVLMFAMIVLANTSTVMSFTQGCKRDLSLRDWDKTETFGFWFETRPKPRPCKAETEMFFETFNLQHCAKTMNGYSQSHALALQ